MESIPDEIGYIKPYLMRSEEMKQADPIVSYYTLRYALQISLDFHKQNPTNSQVKQYIMNMMGVMEEKRKALGEVFEPQQHFEKFITMLFVSCDNDDRKVGSTKSTAQKFLVLSYFIDAMGVFEELPPDWVEKRKYCKWKAADILKALKKGEQPLPGGPGERNGAGMPEERKNEREAVKKPEEIPKKAPEEMPKKSSDGALPTNQYKYTPPEAEKAPVVNRPSASVTETGNKPGRGVLSKEHRAALELSKKMALNAVQELEYKNIQQARIAFEKAIRALDAFDN